MNNILQKKKYHNTKQSLKELQNIAQSVWIPSCVHFPWAAFVTGDKEHWLYLLKWENVGTKRGNSARVNLDHTSGLSLFVKQVGVGFETRPFLYSRCWGWLVVSLSRLSSLSVDGSTRWSESNVEQFDTLIFTEKKKKPTAAAAVRSPADDTDAQVSQIHDHVRWW